MVTSILYAQVFPDTLWAGGTRASPKMNGLAATVAFAAGAIASLVSGFLGMKIAVYANARTALEAQSGIRRAFVVAFRSGAVMGFLLPALGLAVLFAIILVYKKVRTTADDGAHSVCRGGKSGGFQWWTP